MSKKYDIMVAGHVCLDLIPRFTKTGSDKIEEILTPGKLVNMKECIISTGGPVSNTGIALQKLGNSVSFCARVGDDPLGKLTSGLLEKTGNTEGMKKAEKSASSYTIALAPPNIDRIFLHSPGTNDTFSAKDLDPGLISQCKHFHFGYPPLMEKMYAGKGEELVRVMQTARECGAITSLDMALPDPESVAGKAPWADILQNVLPYVDIFFPSVEEILYMLDPDKFKQMKKQHQNADLLDFIEFDLYTELAGRLLDMGVQMTALKAGHKGFYFRTAGHDDFDLLCSDLLENWNERELFSPAFQAREVASATGSGDSSIAGFLSAFIRNKSLEECVKFACLVGWENVQAFDAISGVKSWEDSEQLLQSNTPEMHSIDLSKYGWTWSPVNKLWSGPADTNK
jgi:sugar/nucleoside kinase (ribokinase family)